MIGRALLGTALALACGAPLLAVGSSQSIAGKWRVRLDSADAGTITLPGSTDEHRLGTRNERRELRRLTRAYEFVGQASYEREISIPAEWAKKRITLFLERCHWETRAWLDDTHLGLQNSLSTPHVYELPTGVTPGVHRLRILVDNRLKIDVGNWASAVSEEGPSNWNGLIGRMELRATDDVWIDSVQVYGTMVRIDVRNRTSTAQTAQLELSVNTPEPVRIQRAVAITARPVTSLEVDLPPIVMPAWDTVHPSVHEVIVSLGSDKVTVPFGPRRITAEGKSLKLNSRTIFLRGTVDNGAFPQTGHSAMDVETWRKRFETYRAYGMNHVRFHSWCPPDAAFTAADQLGMVLQVENPMWIGDGRVSADAARVAFIREEAERIVDTYGNHPSFCLMSMGNELGNGLDPFVGKLVRFLQSHDPRRLYTSTSAPDNVLRPDDYFVSAGPRWQNLRGDPRLERNPPDTAFDYREYLDAIDRPVIAHELGQWTVFPHLGEQAKYRGALQPRYFDIYRESMQKTGLTDRNADFTRASGALMVRLYKEEIESILRTPGLAGFQLLGLSDWPGFGPAFTGVLDAMNESRDLISPEAFRRFCSNTVPLLRLTKRIWTTGETLTATLSVAHYAKEPIEGATASWVVRDAKSRTVASSRLPVVNITPGALSEVGMVSVPLRGLPAPARYSIEIQIGSIANDWDFWVYPEQLPAEPRDVLISSNWDDDTRAALREGKTVLITAPQRSSRSTVPASFTTVFWSLVWFPKRPETMGLFCDPEHAALAEFPTEFHSNWQWWDLTSQSRAFVLDDAPQQLQPVVQVIDDANRNHRLAAVFEARVGNGKLLATSFDLERSLETRLAARQLRHSLVQYAVFEKFQPHVDLTIEYLDRLF